MQRQHRIVPRREDEPQRGRRGAQQLVERRGDLDALHRVEVVDHHDDRLLELREAVEQLQHEARRRPRARRRDPRQRRPRRHDALDRREPLGPERRLAESAARREPRDVERLGREPRREQRRLAEAGGRRDERQGTLSSPRSSARLDVPGERAAGAALGPRGPLPRRTETPGGGLSGSPGRPPFCCEIHPSDAVLFGRKARSRDS